MTADAVLSGRSRAIVAHRMRHPMRRVLGRVADLKTLDAVLDLGWHADQLHSLDPDPDRGRLAATVALVRRNGRASFRRSRG